jgi:hypothetical protein
VASVADSHAGQVDRELLVEELLVGHAMPGAGVVVVGLGGVVPLMALSA